MKNIIKTVWSLWTKTDRIIAVVSTIAIITIMCFLCTSCNAQPSPTNIPVMEYNDASGEDFDVTDNYLPLYADGVVDFIYCAQDEEYIIEYNDDDIFDIDNLPQQPITCVSSDTQYVKIFCSEEYFFEYLNWYSQYNRTNDEFFAANDTFYIKEVYLDEEGYGYWYYKLVKK